MAFIRDERGDHAWIVSAICVQVFFSLDFQRLIHTCIVRLQTDYAHEFIVFKPDKKLKWLPHLGTVQLELQLKDRAVGVDVPPLEAAFIELFSEKRLFSSLVFFFFFSFPNFERLVFPYPLAVWTLEELTSSVGSIDRGAAIKALSTWVDRGYLCIIIAFLLVFFLGFSLSN